MSSSSKRLHLQSPVEKSCLHRQAILRASQATNKRFSSEEDAMLRAPCQASLALPAGCQAAKPLGRLSAWDSRALCQLWAPDPAQKGREKLSALPICSVQHPVQLGWQRKGRALPAAATFLLQPKLGSAPRLPESQQRRQFALQGISSLCLPLPQLLLG